MAQNLHTVDIPLFQPFSYAKMGQVNMAHHCAGMIFWSDGPSYMDHASDLEMISNVCAIMGHLNFLRYKHENTCSLVYNAGWKTNMSHGATQ